MQQFLLISFYLLSLKVTVGGGNRLSYIYPKEILCNNDEQCQSIIEGSHCNVTCKCGYEELLSSDGAKCLKKVEGFGHDCDDNVQCSQNLTTGGVCVNSKCKCKTGFHYLKGKCWRNIDLNESCLKNEQCFSAHEYVGLECKSNICTCRANYYQRLNSGCRREMKNSEACLLDSDCPEGYACNKMSCSKVSTSSEEDKSINFEETTFSLKSTLELGDGCYTNTDCEGINHAVCLDSLFCACEPMKYVASEDNKQCLQSARGKVEDIRKSNCKENAQCAVFGGNSICINGKCDCKNGTYWEVESQFCWTIRHIGEECSVAKDCHPSKTFAECIEQVCSCQKGYHQKGTVCVRDATKVGDYCDEDSDCSSLKGYCNESNACDCKENYYPKNGKCLGGVKSSCETDADCCHLNNTQCVSSEPFSFGQCLCVDNYVSSDEGKYCLPVVKAGEKCEESFQCRTDLGEFGECKNGICQCKNKTHYFYGKCYRSKFVKESCTRLQDCHPGNDTGSVICLKGSCSCNYGYELGSFGLCVKTNSAAEMKSLMYVILAVLFLLR